tara:strand:+ start:14310 stop:15329 length:1020 start_codon:yes stop_codon:yes gene_type:complete
VRLFTIYIKGGKRIMKQSKYFYIWIGLSALLIAGSAAAFSVYGLAKLFSGAFLSVVVMASSLELGKLVTASFLYRYWNMINWFQKVYMTLATIVLIFITSAGIFGYLSNAYQGATLEFEKQSTELLMIDDRLEQLQDDKLFLKQELDQQVESLPENYITAKRKLREDYNPQIRNVNEEILNIKTRKADLEIQLVSTGVDVGPAIYLARTFGTDIDTVVKFFIFILIFVFDPLAVMLVIAYNQALILRTKENEIIPGHPEKEKTQQEHWQDVYSEPLLTPNPYGDDDFATPQEDDDRMDIIGQNGNDGLHYDLEEVIEEEVAPKQKINPQPTARGGIRTK